jgi:DNA recombination protein RmuC
VPANLNEVLLWSLLALVLGVVMGWLLLARRAHVSGRSSRDVEVSQLAGERDNALEARRRVQSEHDVLNRELVEHRKRVVELSAESASMAGRLERLTQVETDLSAARADAKHWNDACQRAEQLLTEKATRLQEQTQSAQEKLLLLERLREDFTHQFKTVSGELLETQSTKFTEQNQTNMGTLLNPLREQLGDFRKRVDEVYDKESRERQLLKVEIDSLKDINKSIGVEAVNLTRALKGESRVRGAWGEVILERLLEMAGLQAGRQYETQTGFSNADGKLQKPDVIVRLPDEKDIIVDAKVSLVGWDRYVSAIDDAERSIALREHLASIRRHIDGLAGKDYSNLAGLRTLDFVLLFVPIEAAFMEAVRADDSLYGYALSKNVSIVSPSTLLATLRTVGHLWRIQQRSENVREFSRVAAQLHDNFALLIEGIQEVGEKLDAAQSSHGGLLRRLTEGGRGSVLLQVQRLKELGAQTKKALPRDLLDRAGATDELDASDEDRIAESDELPGLETSMPKTD